MGSVQSHLGGGWRICPGKAAGRLRKSRGFHEHGLSWRQRAAGGPAALTVLNQGWRMGKHPACQGVSHGHISIALASSAAFRFLRVRALGSFTTSGWAPTTCRSQGSLDSSEFLCVWILACAIDKRNAPCGLLLWLLISVSGCFQLESRRGFLKNQFILKNMNLITSLFNILFSRASEYPRLTECLEK